MTEETLTTPFWEQQSDEPDAAYIRFLFYRDLGPGRNLTDAYTSYCSSRAAAADATDQMAVERVLKGPKRPRIAAPGQWKKDSARWDWVHRANMWDIHILSVAERETVLNFYQSLNAYSANVLETVRSGSLRPANFFELLDGLRLLCTYMSPEVVQAWIDFVNASVAGQSSASATAGVRRKVS